MARNRAGGAPGRLIGVDIDPAVGWLVPPGLREQFMLLIEDSTTSLPRLAARKRIDLFIHDSDHRDVAERREYAAVAPALTPRALVLSDNAHATEALRAFAARTGRCFAAWRERPCDHFYPGAGIGLARPAQ